jgi:hypothetical protein
MNRTGTRTRPLQRAASRFESPPSRPAPSSWSASIRRRQLCQLEDWSKVFAVHVDPGPDQRRHELPPVAGSYRTEDGKVCFTPLFPLTPGVRYRAVFDPRALEESGTGSRQEKTVELPRPATPPASVEAIYPTSDELPENQLRFYIHFSAPMSRGEAYARIRLLDSAGKPIEAAFLELGEELWDPSGKRFTLLIDPGRIKRGLKPREDLGPVLEAGKSYSLVVDRDWPDAQGNPLREGYRKSFTAGPPEEEPIDPAQWHLAAPAAGTTEPLTVTFPRPLDHALLHRLVWVRGPAGDRLAGQVRVSDHERRWQFTPQQPWQAGSHQLVIDTTLEDRAGNRVGEPFEVDVFKPIERKVETKTVQVPFAIVP